MAVSVNDPLVQTTSPQQPKIASDSVVIAAKGDG
jgi:hypothetical protein